MKLSEKLDQLLAEAEELARSRGTELRLEAERSARWDQVVDRWNDLAENAASMMSNEDRVRVDQAIDQANRLAGPYWQWLCDLMDGRCRLPELSAEAMRDLLLAWLHPQAEGGIVCTACGLEYPHSKQPTVTEMMSPPVGQGKPWNPELFEACPYCCGPRHGSGMDWPHLVDGKKYSWMDLDGYVGKPIQAKPDEGE